MKRYENMSKEEIMEAYNSTSWCDTCIIKDKCSAAGDGCAGGVNIWLNQEIEMVPRISKINTVEELDNAYQEYTDDPAMMSFYAWLKKEVEK